MAEAASRAAARTTLTIGGVEVPVGLFPTVAKPAALAEFETAGPNGGALVYEQRGVPTPVEPERRSDPLGDNVVGTLEPAPAATPGEFRRVLVEQGSGLVVERDQVRRGVRLGIDRDGAFVDCSAQLDEIEARTKLDRMDVVSFIDVGQVPRERVVAAYYVGATLESGQRTLRLLHDAMRSARRAAVAKWTRLPRPRRTGLPRPLPRTVRAPRSVRLGLLGRPVARNRCHAVGGRSVIRDRQQAPERV